MELQDLPSKLCWKGWQNHWFCDNLAQKTNKKSSIFPKMLPISTRNQTSKLPVFWKNETKITGNSKSVCHTLGLPFLCFDPALNILPWIYHGSTMDLPWFDHYVHHDSTTIPPWFYHGSTMIQRWFYDDSTMILRWFYDDSNTIHVWSRFSWFHFWRLGVTKC